MRWEKLYSGGLGEFHESPEVHRRAIRLKRLFWGLILVGLGIVCALFAWRW